MWDISTGTSSSNIGWVRFLLCKSFRAFILLFINIISPGSSPWPPSETFRGKEKLSVGGGGSLHLCQGGGIFIHLSSGCCTLLSALSTSKRLYLFIFFQLKPKPTRDEAEINCHWVKKPRDPKGDLWTLSVAHWAHCYAYYPGDGPGTR